MNVCTIVTKAYWSHARALAKSVLAFNPAAQVYVLLADQVDGCFDPSAEPFKTVFLEDLGSSRVIHAMSFYYTPFEFCCALRAFLHNYMWEKTTAPTWIFLDSDIHVVGPFDEILESLSTASILLNPHSTAPAPPLFLLGSELMMLKHGLFNGGFLAVRRCEESRPFINWFMNRLARFCFFGLPGLFVDQLWLNHIPLYFRNVRSFTHPGVNLAHWNLFKRTLAHNPQGGYLVDSLPLMAVHFSGWDIDNPREVSKHELGYQKLNVPQLEIWKELGENYRTALLDNGYLKAITWPYAFDKFKGGAQITPHMRRHFYLEIQSGSPQWISPFERSGYFPDTEPKIHFP